MKLPLRRKIEEACSECEISIEVLVHYIDEDWIKPIDWERKILDDEDIARIKLIQELQNDFGVNDEAVPIVLHLLDQLNYFHRYLKE